MNNKLTAREITLLKLITNGDSYKDIAIQLNISEQTIKNHLVTIRFKLNANNTVHAIVICIKTGLLDTKITTASITRKARGPKKTRYTEIVRNPGTNNCTDFCDICHHGVFNLDIHLKTKEHQRRGRVVNNA